MTDWILCKIYKKHSTQSVNHNNQPDQQVQNTRNQEEAIQQQNQINQPAKRPRVSINSKINQPSEQVQHHETFNHLGSMFQSNHQSVIHNNVMGAQALRIGHDHLPGSNTNCTLITPATFQDPNQEQVQSFTGSSTCEHYDQNQCMSASTNVHNIYQEDSQTLVNMQGGYNRSMEEAATDDNLWDLLDYEELLSLLEDEDGHTMN
ncbi:hypothetical protein HanPI659440_Chr08g0294771 [Helianthus annuus]|nr:hypothetical protein HanPI659440_Chr08g0294771 [Helianthus annuus]